MKPTETTRSELTPAVPRGIRRSEAGSDKIVLPLPALSAPRTLDECLRKRRSARDYSPDAMSLDQVNQLLWAAQGITAPAGLRTAPSAGAVYPLRCYLLAAAVDGLAPGFYSFNPDTRQLTLLVKGDKRAALAKICGDQPCVEQCACALLLTGWYKRIRREFGELAERLAAIEAGHVGQNWLLAATALGLGSLGVGKFDAAALRMLLRVSEEEDPLYMMLAGRLG